MTRDGRAIEVFANLGAIDDAAAAVEQGAEGVGLLRTEFLFLGRDELPDEDEQARGLRDRSRAALGGRPLIIRTLDVGADKPLPFLPQEPEANPFLGAAASGSRSRGPTCCARSCAPSLRVGGGAPGQGHVPDGRDARRGPRGAGGPRRGARRDLGIDPPLEVGVMVEVPAVAVAAERFAREVDFLSIGTNDLAQYTMAAERGNARVAALADGPRAGGAAAHRPHACEAPQAHGRWVGVCGELAGDPRGAALLVGLGVSS